jgi:hypothetical protein
MRTPSSALQAQARERARAAAAIAAERNAELAALELADLPRGDRTRAHARLRRERDRAELDELEARAQWYALTDASLEGEARRWGEQASVCARCIDAIHDAFVQIADALDRDAPAERIALGELFDRRESELDAALDDAQQALASLASRSGRRFGED